MRDLHVACVCIPMQHGNPPNPFKLVHKWVDPNLIQTHAPMHRASHNTHAVTKDGSIASLAEIVSKPPIFISRSSLILSISIVLFFFVLTYLNFDDRLIGCGTSVCRSDGFNRALPQE